MKGTFFSADFVKDSSGNLRLLEVNTDTSISTSNLVHLDFSGFVTLLQENSITRVAVIHKPFIHKEIVEKLKEYLTANAPFVTEFTEYKERVNRIYPTAVDDAADLFILRLAYDESAIFDSEYCKSNIKTFALFADAAQSALVPEFYHSSSLGYYDTITDNLNGSNVPDLLVKNTSDSVKGLIKFYKAGSESPDDTAEARLDNIISSVASEDNIIQKYHVHSDAISNGSVTSIRTVSILYGSDLSLLHVGQFEETAAFGLPTVSIYDADTYVNLIDSKHYYEFATNFIKHDTRLDGILNTHLIVKPDDSEVEIGSIAVGDEVKSYYIGGTDLSEDDFNYPTWQISGSTLPSGSYITSASVIYKNSKDLTDKTLYRLAVSGSTDSLYASPTKSFLVYDSVRDASVWKQTKDIVTETNFLIDHDGSLAKVAESEIQIINEDTFSIVELDVEDTDTFIIAGETPINSFVTHNSPCFVAGTLISMGEGDRVPIEDIKEGDMVLTYNLEHNEHRINKVNAVYSKKVDKVAHIIIEEEKEITCTLDHPLYVKGKGWCSVDNDLSNKLYSIESSVGKLEIGDELLYSKGSSKVVSIEVIEEETVVYNLQEVEEHNNFFANGILVHNRAFQPKL